MIETPKLSYRQRWGLWAAIQAAVLWRLRKWFGFRVFGIYLRELKPSTENASADIGFSYRRFEHVDADELVAQFGRKELSLTEPFIRNALNRGSVCEAILHEGQIVSYGWSSFNPTLDEDDVYIEFAASHRFGHNRFTLPEFRGHHLFRPYTEVREADWRARGCTHTIANIFVDNRPSIQSALAQGSRRIGLAGFLKFAGWFVPFRTPNVRRQGFRFFRVAARK